MATNHRIDRLKKTIQFTLRKEILLKMVKKPYLIPFHFWKSIKPIFFDVKLNHTKPKDIIKIQSESIKALAILSTQKEKLVFFNVDEWASDIKDNNDCRKLASLFTSYGSDKSINHNYHLIYFKLLLEKQHHQINILEIGLGTNNLDVPSNMGEFGKPGASLRAFRDMYIKANIFGADVDKRILFNEERISTFYVDQTVPETFNELMSQLNSKFDLIIDDGLHLSLANLNTLNFALKMLKEDGFFVIEDISKSDMDYYKIVKGILKDYSVQFIETKNAAYVCVINKIV